MKKRTWDSKTKLAVVLEGLRGRSVSEICSHYEIGQNQYYQWRDKFLAEAHRAFESTEHSQREEKLAKENRRLKAMVGELTMELKKTESELE
jgi:transposase-like protein